MVESRQPSTASDGQTMLRVAVDDFDQLGAGGAAPQSSRSRLRPARAASAAQVPGAVLGEASTRERGLPRNTPWRWPFRGNAAFSSVEAAVTASEGQSDAGRVGVDDFDELRQVARLPQSSVVRLQTRRACVGRTGSDVTVLGEADRDVGVAHVHGAGRSEGGHVGGVEAAEHRVGGADDAGRVGVDDFDELGAGGAVAAVVGGIVRPARCCVRPGRFRG